jgi:cytochrome c oxidase subunit II
MKKRTLLSLFLFAVMPVSWLWANAPKPWQLGFQEPASPMAEKIMSFHNILMIGMTAIAVFVFILLIIVILRFNHRRNPVPSKTTHNTLIEVVWTIIPSIIVLFIMIPSVKLIYFTDKVPDAEMTLKIVGHQWYWSYEYPDHENIAFDSNMTPDDEIKPGQYRLLEVDNRVVLPVNTNVRLLFTSTDVLHSWAVPAMGIKMDTVPGRLNETWLRANREGVFYGQCSELCGINHGFMPIALEIVSKEKFEEWLGTAKVQFAQGKPTIKLAMNISE